jgi:transposase
MEHYAGIDVSLEWASVCVVDASGKIVREGKVAGKPEALIGWFGTLGLKLERIGLEAGPLSQWLYAGLRQARLAVELLEMRHVRKALETMPVKSDRDATVRTALYEAAHIMLVHLQMFEADVPIQNTCARFPSGVLGKLSRPKTWLLRIHVRQWKAEFKSL